MSCFTLPLSTGRTRRFVAALLGAACLAGAHASEYASTVIASGLNSPRGLSFGPDGALWIAEAGLTGGIGPSIVVRGATNTLTDSGSISRWFAGTQERVYTGIASIYASNGDINGPNDIVFGPGGTARVAVGAGFDPTLRPDLGAAGLALGRLLTPGGASIDVSGHELANNPAGGPLDSNPWHLARIDGATLVTDAGANALLRVGDDGMISTVATFAARAIGGPFPTESVPTGLAVGPDGAYYVGELSGFPFIPGASRIHRVLADGTSAVFADGFTQITDMAFGADGMLYVLELDDNGLLASGGTGALYRLGSDGSRELIFSDGLVQPTGLEIGSDGSFYISNFGNSGGQGEVLRVAAIPEPETYALLLAGFAALGAIRRRKR